MTQEHPITPPYELVQQLCKERACISKPGPVHLWLATQFARWGADQQLQLDAEQINQAWQKGADQELEACCEWLVDNDWAIPGGKFLQDLRAARRPKPPSLKEQALETLRSMQIDPVVINGINVNAHVMNKYDIIRRALESLPD